MPSENCSVSLCGIYRGQPTYKDTSTVHIPKNKDGNEEQNRSLSKFFGKFTATREADADSSKQTECSPAYAQ